MRFENWRFSEATSYVSTKQKKALKLNPRAPSGFSSIAFEAAMLAQRPVEPDEPAPQFSPNPVTAEDSIVHGPPGMPQSRADLGN